MSFGEASDKPYFSGILKHYIIVIRFMKQVLNCMC